MGKYKSYEVNKGLFGIGLFEGEEMLKGTSYPYYKTKKGADKKVKTLMSMR